MTASSTDVQRAIDGAQALITFLFSWVILLGVSVIITGKLTAKHFVLNLGPDDLFSINLIAFRIRAKGDEVSLGFIVFVIALVVIIFGGGKEGYEIFKERAGIDVGQWNSICVMASFLSIITSLVVAICMNHVNRATPIISQDERKKQIEEVTALGEQNE